MFQAEEGGLPYWRVKYLRKKSTLTEKKTFQVMAETDLSTDYVGIVCLPTRLQEA